MSLKSEYLDSISKDRRRQASAKNVFEKYRRELGKYGIILTSFQEKDNGDITLILSKDSYLSVGNSALTFVYSARQGRLYNTGLLSPADAEKKLLAEAIDLIKEAKWKQSCLHYTDSSVKICNDHSTKDRFVPLKNLYLRTGDYLIKLFDQSIHCVHIFYDKSREKGLEASLKKTAVQTVNDRINRLRPLFFGNQKYVLIQASIYDSESGYEPRYIKLYQSGIVAPFSHYGPFDANFKDLLIKSIREINGE